MLGFAYFLAATALITIFQENLADTERAVVMPLWFMSFGGSIPLGNLLFGPIIDAIGARWVLGLGAVVAVVPGVVVRPAPDAAASSFLAPGPAVGPAVAVRLSAVRTRRAPATSRSRPDGAAGLDEHGDAVADRSDGGERRRRRRPAATP